MTNKYYEATLDILKQYPNITYVEHPGEAIVFPKGPPGPRAKKTPTLWAPKPTSRIKFFWFCHELGHLVTPRAAGPSLPAEEAATAFAFQCFQDYDLEITEEVHNSWEKYHKILKSLDKK